MNAEREQLSDLREDVFREIANIGAGNAATALSELLGRPITQSLPEVLLAPLSEVPRIMGGAEKVVLAGLLALSGGIGGYLLIILDLRQAGRIVSTVTGENAGAGGGPGLDRFSELEQSVLSETVNIMGGAYLTAVCRFTHLEALQSVPYLCVDMTGAVLNVAIAEIGRTGDYAMVLRSQFSNDREMIDGNLFLVPDAVSCEKILTSLGLGDGV